MIWLTRLEALQHATFSRGMKTSDRAVKQWGEMCGGFDLLRATLEDMRKEERERDRLLRKVFEGWDSRTAAAPTPPTEGETDASDDPHAPPSSGMPGRSKPLVTPAKRDFQDLNEQEKRLELAIYSDIWAAASSEAIELEAKLPTRRHADADPATPEDGWPMPEKDQTSPSKVCDLPQGRQVELNHQQSSCEPTPGAQPDEGRVLSPEEAALREEAAAFERYSNLNELQKDQLDNLELVERFDPGYSEKLEASCAAERDRLAQDMAAEALNKSPVVSTGKKEGSVPL